MLIESESVLKTIVVLKFKLRSILIENDFDLNTAVQRYKLTMKSLMTKTHKQNKQHI